MINGLQTSGLAALGQSTKLGIISNNLANIDTVGFRRESLTFGERLVEALEEPQDFDHYNFWVDRYGGAPHIRSMHVDPTAGGLEETGGVLDLAVNAPDGFFSVTDPANGQRYFTRAGNFALNAAGVLVTADGKYRVGDGSGEAIQIDVTEGTDLIVGRDGSIRVLGADGQFVELGRVGVFRVQPDDLLKHGDTLLKRRPGVGEPVAVDAPDVRQGYLESSSVDPIEEMVQLIQTSRFVESNLQMIRFQDGTLDRLINNLGRLAGA